MKEELQNIKIGVKQLEEDWKKIYGTLEDLEGYIQEMKDAVKDVVTAEEEEEEQDD